MLELAQKYARLLRTKVLSSREEGDTLIFVLASGPKLTMTKSELTQAIATEQDKRKADEFEEEEPAPAKSKSKKEK